MQKSKLRKIMFITGNPGKAEQLSRYLNYPVDHKKLDMIEIQSLDIEEVAKHKALEAYKKIKKPIIIDDNSLIIHAFGNLPGTLIKWFGSEIGFENFGKLLDPYKDRSATAIVAVTFYNGKILKTFLGEEKGTIAKKSAGENGFGWDIIFIPEGYQQTRASMNGEDYDQTSPRRKALEKLKEFLEENEK
jgi:non-canonical purine NTP pyrophosphatase (RdgB/HAM1 family)